MTDRELLEAAARAAGLKLTWLEDDFSSFPVVDDAGEINGLKEWNPLTDDGDALRLAVKRELQVWNTPNDARVYDVYTDKHFVEPHGSDPCAATRRAIVRAAAAMASASAI